MYYISPKLFEKIKSLNVDIQDAAESIKLNYIIDDKLSIYIDGTTIDIELSNTDDITIFCLQNEMMLFVDEDNCYKI